MNAVLGQSVDQVLADIDGLLRVLWQIPDETLKRGLETSAQECRALLERAKLEDVDPAPGIDCVIRLYEAFEEAKRAPPTTPAARRARETAESSAMLFWIIAVGAALVGIVSSIVD